MTRRLPLAGPAGVMAAIASLTGIAATIVLGPRAAAPGAPAPLAAPRASEAVPLDGERLAYWQRFALNALLVPLLDVDEQERWAEPSSAMPCLETSQVTLDGRPLPAGERLPAGEFTLRWTLADCRPFGPESLALWGSVEARLRNVAGRVGGVLHSGPLLVVEGDGRPLRVDAPFVATVALVPVVRIE